ncbi:hypothetical protein ACLMJK_008497 [Lecanora helva]
MAHSWIEQMMVISSNGQFTGNPGYARNNTLRTAPGFSDPLMVHILPGAGQPSIEQRDTQPSPSDTQGVLPTDPMCKKTQQEQFQSNGSPRLKAAPGDMIALRYEENGHVTLPDNQKGKPKNRGTVYIYGTTQPKQDEKFLDIFGKWTADGSGGDKRGKLLATQDFDDGQCYQVNSGQISTTRQKEFPHTANQLMGANLWCQNDIKLPTDAPNGKPYTIYWVWDWPTLPGADPARPKGIAEIYTTCMDVDITGTKASRDLESHNLEDRDAPASSGNIGNSAVPKYVKQLAAAPVQQPSQPSAAASQAAAAPAAPPAASSAPAAAPAAAGAAGNAAGGEKATVTVTVTQAPGAQASTPAQQAPAPQAPAPQAPAAPASVPAGQAPAPQPPAAPASAPAAQAPAAQAPAASPAAAKPATNAMPPSNLNIAAPVLSAGSSGYVNTAPAVPMATFPGTASAIAPSTMLTAPNSAKTQPAAVGARSCPAKGCQQKRSKIFGNPSK